MNLNPFAPSFIDLPETLPIFPLVGALLLPSGQLPLNVFERRYTAMVDEAIATDRFVGIVQPKDSGVVEICDDTALFKTGCAGKITALNETEDGRYLITLTGICRFNIAQELPVYKGFRSVRADWSAFENDIEENACFGLDRDRLVELLQTYFNAQEMECDWDAVKTAPDDRLITCLSMVCPFSACEKQALLEATCCKSRAKMFLSLLEMATCEDKDCGSHH